MIQCEQCGAVLAPDCTACPVCGHPHTPAPPPPDKSLSTAQCLGILLVGLIPVAGLIALCVWAFRRRTPRGRAHLARAVLILHLLLAVSGAAAAVKGAILYQSWADSYYPGFEYYDPGFPYGDDWIPPEEWDESGGWDDYGDYMIPYDGPSAVSPLQTHL